MRNLFFPTQSITGLTGGGKGDSRFISETARLTTLSLAKLLCMLSGTFDRINDDDNDDDDDDDVDYTASQASKNQSSPPLK